MFVSCQAKGGLEPRSSCATAAVIGAWHLPAPGSALVAIAKASLDGPMSIANIPSGCSAGVRISDVGGGGGTPRPARTPADGGGGNPPNPALTPAAGGGGGLSNPALTPAAGGVLPESVDRGVVAVPELHPTNACESRLSRQVDLLVVLIWQIEGSCSKLCSSRFLHRVVRVTREINKGNPLALDGKRCMWYRPIELEPFVPDVMNFPSNL